MIAFSIDTPIIAEYKPGQMFPFRYWSGNITIRWIDDDFELHEWIETQDYFAELS